HTSSKRDWSSDVCSSDLGDQLPVNVRFVRACPSAVSLYLRCVMNTSACTGDQATNQVSFKRNRSIHIVFFLCCCKINRGISNVMPKKKITCLIIADNATVKKMIFKVKI